MCKPEAKVQAGSEVARYGLALSAGANATGILAPLVISEADIDTVLRQVAVVLEA